MDEIENSFSKRRWSLKNWDDTLDVWRKRPTAEQLLPYTDTLERAWLLLEGGTIKIDKDYFWLFEDTYV